MLTLQTSFSIERSEVKDVCVLKDLNMPSREVFKRLFPNEKVLLYNQFLLV